MDKILFSPLRSTVAKPTRVALMGASDEGQSCNQQWDHIPSLSTFLLTGELKKQLPAYLDSACLMLMYVSYLHIIFIVSSVELHFVLNFNVLSLRTFLELALIFP